MSSSSWTSRAARLVCATGQGLVEGNLVAVSATDAGRESAGLLIRDTGQAEEQRAVRIVPVPQLPAGTVAISDAMADDLGMRGEAIQWRLEPADAVQASAMVLESLTEGKLTDMIDLLAQARDLAGQVFWLAGEGGTAWVHAAGTPFRVRSASGPGGESPRGLVQVTPGTRIDLIAPGNRTGVDIVILADCSGSMSWNDIERRGDVLMGSSGARYVTRMDALKSALGQMIDIRAHTSGRVSRIALVSFTDRARCEFPSREGMAELNGMDDPRALSQFRQAVGLLRPQDAGTDIGKALHFAAELLHRQGVPDNERLIVLVSDGADWHPKNEDTTGEAVVAVTDPVSLMEELEQSLAIKLHAIGIGEKASFHAWYNRYERARRGGVDPHESTVPNHELLEKLVEVGGGDPRRVGGLEVLQDYFSGLGEGVTRHVGRPAAGEPRPMQGAGDLETLAEPKRAEDQGLANRRAELADRARQLRPACVKLCQRCGANPMYRKDAGDFSDKLLRLGRAVGTEDEFRVWVNDLNQVFEESLDSRLRTDTPPRPYDIADVARLARDGRLNQIRLLRNWAGHMDPKDEVILAQIFTRFAGRKLIDADDAPRWTQVQVGLLEDLVGFLEDVRKALEEAPMPAPPSGLRPTPHVDGWR
jgi:hypothetical protein